MALRQIWPPARWAVAAGALGLLVVLAACSSHPAPAACPEHAIIALGDSITYGAGFPRTESYPAQLQQILGRPVCNAGVNGNQAADALARLQRDVLRYRPRAVVILLGANDCGLLGQPTDPETFRSEMTTIVRRVKAAGATPVVASLLPLNPPVLRAASEIPDRWPIYDQIVRDVAAEQEAVFVDLTVALNGDVSLLADGVHPNPAGSRVIATAVAAAFERAGL